MDEIYSSIKSVGWWFTAVFVALLVNLASSYVRDATDKVWRHAKAKLGVHTKRIAASNASFLEQLKTDEALRRFLFEAEIRSQFLSLNLLLLGFGFAVLGFFVMGSPGIAIPSIWGRPIGLFSVVFLYYSMDQFAIGRALSQVLIQVEKSRVPTDVADVAG